MTAGRWASLTRCAHVLVRDRPGRADLRAVRRWRRRRADDTGPGAPAPALLVSHARLHLASYHPDPEESGWFAYVNAPSGAPRMKAGEQNDVCQIGRASCRERVQGAVGAGG